MPLCFDSFELDEERFELRRNGKPVSVQPRVLDTILFLASRRGRLVTKEELIEGPWQGAAVSDTALSQAIRQARAALGEDPRAPRYIQTVRGKGFRFHAEVTTSDGATTLQGPPRRAAKHSFFGRSKELERLRLTADEARAGRGQLVLIHGAAGVGKTRLLECFASEQRQAGTEICWGGCREGQTAPPFWPWPEVLTRYAEAHDELLLQQLARGRTLELSALAPELAGVLGVAASHGVSESPERAIGVLDATVGFLRRAAARAPLILVMEDLHLADEAALALLEVLARSIGDTRLLVLGTCRSQEGVQRPELKAALERTLPHLQALELGGLGLAEVRGWLQAVARDPVPEHVVKALHFSTDGHPLLLENLVEALPEAWSAPAEEQPALLRWPERIGEVLRRRFLQLDQAALDALRWASVFGEEFPIGVLVLASGRPPSTLLPELERAQRLGLLKPAGRARLRFSHALHRDLLYQELEPDVRLEKHLSTAQAFAKQLPQHPEWVVEAAHHFVEAAARAGSSDVIRYARQAAEWARARHAYGVAERYYRRALDVLELGSASPRLRSELLLELGQIRYLAGHVPHADKAFEAVFELSHRHGYHDLFCQTLLSLFQMRREAVAVDRAFHQRLNQALDKLGPNEPAFAQLLTVRAMTTVLTATASTRVKWLVQALRIARSVGSKRVLLDVIRNCLYCYTRLTDGSSVLSLSNEMVELARTLQSPEDELLALQWRAHALLELGRGRDFETQLTECVQQAAILRSPHASYVTEMLQSGLAFLAGSLEESEHLARASAMRGEALTGIGATGHLCGQLFALALEAGASDRTRLATDALRLSEQVLALAPNYQVMVAAMARLQLYLGYRQPALQLLAKLTRNDFSSLDALDRNYLPTLVCLADIACFEGESKLALTVKELMVEHLDWHVTAANGSVYLGPVSYWLGRLSLTMEDFTKARQLLERSIQECLAARSVTFRAWSEYYLAQSLPASDGPRRLELLARVTQTAQRHALGRLMEQLAEPQRGTQTAAS